MSERKFSIDDEHIVDCPQELHTEPDGTTKACLSVQIGAVSDAPSAVERFHALISNLFKDYFKRLH
jgi:hypothetical protein